MWLISLISKVISKTPTDLIVVAVFKCHAYIFPKMPDELFIFTGGCVDDDGGRMFRNRNQIETKVTSTQECCYTTGTLPGKYVIS